MNNLSKHIQALSSTPKKTTRDQEIIDATSSLLQTYLDLNSQSQSAEVEKMVELARQIDQLTRLLDGYLDQHQISIDWIMANSILSFDPQLQELITELLDHQKDTRTLSSLLNNGDRDKDLIAKQQDNVLDTGEIRRLVEVARDPSTTPSTLSSLAALSNPQVSAAVAMNEESNLEDLIEIAKSQNQTVELALLSRDKLQFELISLLGSSPNSLVRARLSKRLDLPPEIAANLALDHDEKVREAIAVNPNLPAGAKLRLASDTSRSVRFAIIRDRNASKDVIEAAYNCDPNDERMALMITESPEASPWLLAELASSTDYAVRLRVANHHSTPLVALRELAKDGDSSIRTAVSVHPNLDLSMLEELSKDGEAMVRRGVVLNPKTPDGLLLDLSDDPIDCVKRSIWDRKEISQELKASLLLKGDLNPKNLNP
ncbi:MAG: hypothetical protein M0Z45_01280 [Actinomycetota bacterium]|nr:hypothetical protein [Actinomycetota bacterium]